MCLKKNKNEIIERAVRNYETDVLSSVYDILPNFMHRDSDASLSPISQPTKEIVRITLSR